MNPIPAKQIDGDVSVSRNVNTGGDTTIRGNAVVDHNLKVGGWLDAPNIIGPNKGVFETINALREAYPNPRRGLIAIIGTGASGKIARVNTKQEWELTEEDAEISLTDYGKIASDISSVSAKAEAAMVQAVESLRKASNNRTTLEGHATQINDLWAAHVTQGNEISNHDARLDTIIKVNEADRTLIEQNKLAITNLSTELTAVRRTLEEAYQTADTELSKRIEIVTSALDALISDDITGAIDNYNEIINFLNSFDDTDELAPILKDIRDSIEAEAIKQTNTSNILSTRIDTVAEDPARVRAFNGFISSLDMAVSQTSGIYYSLAEQVFVEGVTGDTRFQDYQFYNNDSGTAIEGRIFNCHGYLYHFYDGEGLLRIPDEEDVAEMVSSAKTALFDDLWLQSGGSINDGASPYGRNGIDLTYSQAIAVYDAGAMPAVMTMAYAGNRFIRTNINRIPDGMAMRAQYAFRDCTALEVAAANMAAVSDGCFEGCTKLHTVLGTVYTDDSMADAFKGCASLENINIVIAGNHSFSFGDSPNLSRTSLEYLVGNARNSAEVTILLHPDVFARLNSDEAKWQDLKAAADARNIRFVEFDATILTDNVEVPD